jgi:O-acetyl-ADP-ribose deacetylase (regulator of RNase III)
VGEQFHLRIVDPKGRRVELHGPADITGETTDAIVNAANSYLIGGGGVDGAIHEAGGPSILAECRNYVAQHGRLPAGRVMLTCGGRLAAKYVIHTVGPVYRDGNQGEDGLLASCYRESIRLSEVHNLSSIAFPAISTGAFGFPMHRAAQIAIETIFSELEQTNYLQKIRFVLFEVYALKSYVSTSEKLIKAWPHYMVEKANNEKKPDRR